MKQVKSLCSLATSTIGLSTWIFTEIWHSHRSHQTERSEARLCSISRVLQLWRRLTQILSFQTPVSLLALPTLSSAAFTQWQVHIYIPAVPLHPLRGLGVPQLFDKLKVHRNLFWSKSRTPRFLNLTKLKLLNAVELLWKPKVILGENTHLHLAKTQSLLCVLGLQLYP